MKFPAPLILVAALALPLRLPAAPTPPAAESAVRAAAPAIRLNTVGYLPAAPKHASVVGATAPVFTVLRTTDGAVVLSGSVGTPILNRDTGELLSDLDFSALRAPGDYRLELAGLAASPTFRIAEDLYREPLVLVTRAMYLWRCGVAVDADWRGQHFHHDACHLDDAWLDHAAGRHEKIPSLGGWHDAGDYNKYVVNAGITVGAMLRAWEDFPALRTLALQLPESGGPLPDFLAEVKFETDWLLTMQAPDGSVYTKVSTEGFGGFTLPEEEKTPRYFCPAGTPAAADFVAMLAQAARAFRPHLPAYADRCLAAATRTRAYLAAHPQELAPDQSKFRTGAYDTTDADDRLWAAAEFWATTGDAAALRETETRLRALTPAFEENFDWADVKNLALFTYLFSPREGRSPELLAALRQSLLAVADTLVVKARVHGYARPLDATYFWGCNGGVARQTLLLHAAHRLSSDPNYRSVALDAVNHLLGRNVDGRSYVTGLGFSPPQHPHDRRSSGAYADLAWPGYLVGGPHPTARDWHDETGDYRTNEIAINWNAALIYAFAALLPAP